LFDEAKRRTQNIQKMLLLRDPEQANEAGAKPHAEPTGPPTCREALANWPDEWREQWGRLANELEETGLHWKEAEARAFVEVWGRRRAQAKAQGRAPAATVRV
jgi:hypothetical protein